MEVTKATPSFTEFNPLHIPFQAEVVHDIDFEFDYSLGTHEILLSGSVGSAKSILATHLVVRHCLTYTGAKCLIARKALPDLKETLFALIVEHLRNDEMLSEGRDYYITENIARIRFRNGSQIISRSWADKKYKKLRSLALSMAVIEELTENDEEDSKAFYELKQRIGRLPHIDENLLVCCTNPDSPRHWAYKYFFLTDEPTRHVYKSRTEDNPFLPKSYIEQLKKDLPPKEAQRMLYGEWVEIDTERVYYAYNSDIQYLKRDYEIDLSLPIDLCFDFNIGLGKPMSNCVGQFHSNDSFHLFDEVILEGSRTQSVLDEYADRGLFENKCSFRVFGDETGNHKDTRSIHSDYDIIKKFLNNYVRKDGSHLNFTVCVPTKNPPIRKRHNIVNAYCLNELGNTRLFVYAGSQKNTRSKYKCETVDEGMRLTALKKGAEYIEDDSRPYQHVTTAIGYYISYQNHLITIDESMRKAGLR